MTERRTRGRPPVVMDKSHGEETAEEEVAVIETPVLVTDLCRLQLRSRWELASVLNFLHVFRPIILGELKIPAEEIERALITADHVLAKIHVTLLKGIPPASKNLNKSDAWLILLSKKLKTWWSWVAEGEVPLVIDNGMSLTTYKGLDPVMRLLILKALCEIRLQQDDILAYIDEEVKRGGQLSKFRKDSTYKDGSGTTYWHDGDSVIGHRLYKNVTKVEYKPRPKGRGRLTQPTVEFQWETLATNCHEFRQITEKLMSSKISSESALGTIVRNEILPAVEEVEKKKERLLKRKEKQARLFEGLKDTDFTLGRRSCRDRRPVCYTFDEFDQSIDEALEGDESPRTISPAAAPVGPSEALPEMRKRLRERPTANAGFSG